MFARCNGFRPAIWAEPQHNTMKTRTCLTVGARHWEMCLNSWELININLKMRRKSSLIRVADDRVCSRFLFARRGFFSHRVPRSRRISVRHCHPFQNYVGGQIDSAISFSLFRELIVKVCENERIGQKN
ncbi:unnamed protein product [Nesidiocoris tenuis]|uniref:Uncharacterized protein n=1 Tax=Nesidiocoris tenuis TaxID=355587 RepID=A0A6H5GM72_9HEMI|nr:unnamed protein product [Nesidiocoris tenuis]